MNAIPTMYCGIEYRSRLEARWASFFRGIGWEYTYEPFDGNGYIPDFLIHGERPLLVEVKPAATKADYEAPIVKVEHGLINVWNGDVLIVGADPLPRIDLGENHALHEWWPSVGIIGQWMGCSENFPDEWSWDEGAWLFCERCKRTCVHNVVQSWVGVPCGHADGDTYRGFIKHRDLASIWSAACNDVKWRGTAAS